ncbi:MAG: 1-acyl-sn-glycerol-3-phosphate acyltransferase [Deltaproteobacteria bacterium]|nr:1-acyl-sn-glycerol-3-phosphate acyltransferase [Deltaproteobacteria bacterium]
MAYHIMRTVIVIIWVVLATILCSSVAIVLSLFEEGDNLSHSAARLWAKSILLVSGVKVKTEGLSNINEHTSCIYMANHQSMFDILALFGYLPVQFRWLAKKELFHIPLFGHAMARVGYISIDRSNRRSAHKSLLEAARKIAGGVSVVIFPEGSRSQDGELKPFQPGGFHLAMLSGRPIVPIIICGTHDVMPKGNLHITPGDVIVSIKPTIETTDYGKKDKKNIMDKVHLTMEQDIARIKAHWAPL